MAGCIEESSQQYLRCVIQLEGIFETLVWEDVDLSIVFLYMYACCGEKGRLGFARIMGKHKPFPDDAWVEAFGTLEFDDEFLVFRSISITEMSKRGLEFVS